MLLALVFVRERIFSGSLRRADNVHQRRGIVSPYASLGRAGRAKPRTPGKNTTIGVRATALTDISPLCSAPQGACAGIGSLEKKRIWISFFLSLVALSPCAKSREYAGEAARKRGTTARESPLKAKRVRGDVPRAIARGRERRPPGRSKHTTLAGAWGSLP
jgi:hypothetical protein